MYFPTASLCVIALSFLLTATGAQVIDPSNIKPSSSISTTTTEPQQYSTHRPPGAQVPCAVTVNGHTLDICKPGPATEGSSITAAPHSIPPDTFQRPCITTIGGIVHDLCNELLASGDSSAKTTMQPYDGPDQNACTITVNGTPFEICNAKSATGASSATVAPQYTGDNILQASCLTTVNGVVINTCDIFGTPKDGSTTAAQHPQASCLVTDSHGHVHNTCPGQAATGYSSTTAAPQTTTTTTTGGDILQGSCWITVNGKVFGICNDLEVATSLSSTTTAAAPTQAYTKEEL